MNKISKTSTHYTSSQYYALLSERLQNNKDIVLLFIKANPSCHLGLPKTFQNDKEIAKIVFAVYPQMYIEASEEIRHDKELLLMCLSENNELAIKTYKSTPDILKKIRYFKRIAEMQC